MRSLIAGRPARALAVLATLVACALVGGPTASAYQLYVGTQAGDTDYLSFGGGKVFRYASGAGTWTEITPPDGIGYAVMDLRMYGGRLYAATQRLHGYSDDDDTLGEVWRYDGGTSWTRVGEFDYAAMAMVEYRGELYAATAGYPDDTPPGANLYRYTGTLGSWDLAGHDLEPDGHGTGFFAATVSALSGTDEIVLGDYNTDRWSTYSPETGLVFRQDENGSCVWDFAEFEGALYSGHWWGPIFRTTDARTWTFVTEDFDRHFWGLETFQGQLFLGSSGYTDYPDPPFYSGRLSTLDPATATITNLWEFATDDPDQGVTRLAARRDDSLLFIGTGQRAGYYRGDGMAAVWAYDGLAATPTRISGEDQFLGGVQSLLVVEEVSVDVKPRSCPNPLNTGQRGVLPVAVLGASGLPVADIDPATVRLMGVASLRWAYEDVATPGPVGGDPTDPYACTTEGPDGVMDLTLKFSAQEVIAALEAYLGRPLADREVLGLTLTAQLTDGTPVTGQDVVLILEKGK